MEKYKQNLRVDGGRVFSYNTHVATIQGNKLLLHGYWSMTTSKHVNYVAREYRLTIVDEPKETTTGGTSVLDSACLVAKMGELLCNNKAEKNTWKKRMLNAVPGISFPDDWDTLTEEEKEKRLNAVIM